MKRKAGATRSPLASGVMTPARAWYLTAPRVADEVLGLDLSLRGVQIRALSAADLVSDLPPETLLMLVQDQTDRTGLALVDASLLAGLIEVQMTGRVGTAPPPDRRPTPTDAALVSTLLDALCAAFDQAVSAMEHAPAFAGARFATHIADPRAALIALPEGQLQVAQLAFDLGGGARQGQLTLAMPMQATVTAKGAVERKPIGEALRPVVMDSPALVEAVLHRLRLPYARLRDLAPGDLIDVPRSAISDVSIEAPVGRRLAGGRLGQANGWKAVCLALKQPLPSPVLPPRAAPAALSVPASVEAALPKRVATEVTDG